MRAFTGFDRAFTGLATSLSSALFVFLLATVGWVVSATGQAPQNYIEGRISKQFDQKGSVASYKQRKKKILTGKEPFDAAVLNTYYKGYVFPAMSLDAHRGDVADLRLEIVKDLAQPGITPEAHQAVRGMAFDLGCQMAEKNFRPTARFNAALLVGQLNDTEAVLRGNPKPPVPMAKALSKLVRWLRGDDIPDPVKVAALLGLKRHAQLRGPAGAAAPFSQRPRDGIAQIMFTLVESEAPADRNEEAHNWIRARAVETVGQLRSAAGAATKLGAIVADQNNSLDVRCAAAESLGLIDYNKDKTNVKPLVAHATRLAADCCEMEESSLLEIAKATGRSGSRRSQRRPQPPRNPMGPDTDDDELVITDQQTMPARRRLIQQLNRIRAGLVGDRKQAITGMAQAPGGDMATSVAARLQEIITALEKTETELITLAATLRSNRAALAALAPAPPVAPPPVEPPAEQPPATPDPETAAVVE